MIDYFREFDTKEEANAYARTFSGYWTITIMRSRVSGKWIVNVF